MRFLAGLATAFFCLSQPLVADEAADRLVSAMKLQETMEILAQEGRDQARDLGDALLDDAGGDYFASQVAEMYDPVWMRIQISDSLSNGMSQSQIEQAAIFFESDLGQTVVSLENSARQAMSDDTIDEMAQQNYATSDKGGTFYRLVDEYVQVNNLVEQNAQTSFNSNYAFARGLANGRDQLREKEWLLDNLLSSDEKAREETVTWVYSFLLLAYQPLSEAELRENIAFSRTEAGRTLNQSLFEAYDRMMVEITFNLGEAIVHAMQASDL